MKGSSSELSENSKIEALMVESVETSTFVNTENGSTESVVNLALTRSFLSGTATTMTC